MRIRGGRCYSFACLPAFSPTALLTFSAPALEIPAFSLCFGGRAAKQPLPPKGKTKKGKDTKKGNEQKISKYNFARGPPPVSRPPCPDFACRPASCSSFFAPSFFKNSGFPLCFACFSFFCRRGGRREICFFSVWGDVGAGLAEKAEGLKCACTSVSPRGRASVV